MDLFEAKQLLKSNGYKLIKEGQLNEFLGLGKDYTESAKAVIKAIDRGFKNYLMPLHKEEYNNPFRYIKSTLERAGEDKEKLKYYSKFHDNVTINLYFVPGSDEADAYEKIMGTLVECGLEFKEAEKVYAVDIGELNDDGESKWTKFESRLDARNALKEEFGDEHFEHDIYVIKKYQWKFA